MTENFSSFQVNFAQKNLVLVAGRRQAEISVFDGQNQIIDENLDKRQFVVQNVVSGKNKSLKQVVVDEDMVARGFVETNDCYPDQDKEFEPPEQFLGAGNGEISVSLSDSYSQGPSCRQESSECDGPEIPGESNSRDSYHEGKDIFFNGKMKVKWIK